MKKKTWIFVVVFVLLLSSYAGCNIFKKRLKPQGAFALAKAPIAPNYANKDHWASLPEKKDNADVAPKGEKNLQEQAKVDVFFIHPTTYYMGANWNQPLTNKRANRLTDHRVLRNQASVFNSCARIYAPRYRQAILYSFMTDQYKDADAAINLAYQDVVSAFKYYLKHFNQKRPIIIAAHSQGSYHALRLLRDHFSQKPLLKKLVAAYLLGIPIPMDAFSKIIPDIPLAKSAKQTGCVITWNTFAQNASTERLFKRLPIAYPHGYESNMGKKLACVNPLSWKIDKKTANSSLHLGAVSFGFGNRPNVDKQIISAQCLQGVLLVSKIPRKYKMGIMMRKGDYHVLDYPLFYMNIRKNAKDRVTAFQNQ